jgi:amidohydrolase
MIDQGAVVGVQAMLAVHVEPFLEAGVIGVRKGPLTSSCRSFQVTIHGKSGHSARPFQAIDPIQAATSVIDLFYQLAPRSMDSRYPLALTVGAVHAGSAFNAIPDEAVIRGTLRTARPEDEKAVEAKMHAVLRGVAEATGCRLEIVFPQYAPATSNDEGLIDIMAGAASQLLGPQGVRWLDVPSLGAEDFAFYQQVVPGAIVRLGAAMPDPASRQPLHSSLFDIDERALSVGVKFMTRSALMAAKSFAR